MIIVLIPGFPDFTRLAPLIPLQYFVKVGSLLRGRGFEVIEPRFANAFETIETRARQLQHLLLHGDLRNEARRVHLIGHSAGGIAARFLVSPNGLDLGHRVQSITTIGTPHRGTPVADAVIAASSAFPASFLDTLKEFRKAPEFAAGVHELTTDAMAQFNQNVINAGNVRYLSYAGTISPARLDVTLFRAAKDLLAGADHDGWVPTESARWTGFVNVLPADHGQQIGWDTSPEALGVDLPNVDAFDHLAFYRTLGDDIAKLGE